MAKKMIPDLNAPHSSPNTPSYPSVVHRAAPIQENTSKLNLNHPRDTLSATRFSYLQDTNGFDVIDSHSDKYSSISNSPQR